MTESAELSLGIIAFAVVVMALIQVGAIIAGMRMARRVNELATQLDQEVKPLIQNLTNLSSEAVRTASLAAAQVEKFDRMFTDIARRVDDTLAAAQDLVTGPAREGLAIAAGFKAAFEALRGFREASRHRTATRPAVDEEESLFIG